MKERKIIMLQQKSNYKSQKNLLFKKSSGFKKESDFSSFELTGDTEVFQK